MHASPSLPYIFHHSAQNKHSEWELLKYIPQLPHGYNEDIFIIPKLHKNIQKGPV